MPKVMGLATDNDVLFQETAYTIVGIPKLWGGVWERLNTGCQIDGIFCLESWAGI